MTNDDFAFNGATQIKDKQAHANDGRGYTAGWANGLTKRELFAAMAMVALIDRRQEAIFGLAEASVRMADELIQELKNAK